MAAVQLKLYLHPQASIRRFAVDADTTFEQFQQQVRKFYPEHVEELTFQYLDEEDDLVSFSSNHEWTNALANHNETKAKLLRVKVKPFAVRRPQPQWEQRQQQCQRPRGCFFGPRACHQRPPVQEHNIEEYINQAAPLLKQLFGIDVQVEKEEKNEEAPQTQQKEEAPQQPQLPNFFPFQLAQEQNIEAYINQAAPLLKQLFGIDIQVEKEEAAPKQEQPVEEKPAEEKQEEVEEIIIPEDEEPVEQVHPKVEAPVEETKPVEQVPTPAPVEQAPVVAPHRYASELETLNNMGFTNNKLNEHLLENFKGDLVRVVNALVQVSLKQ